MVHASILRILIDLIKADAVIDSTEMNNFSRLQAKYHISNAHQKKASELTLAEAIYNLKSVEFLQKERETLLEELKDMTLVDGFCVKKEALILTAMHYCLSTETLDSAEVISINVPDISIAEDQVVYVESESNPSIHKEILSNFRQLNTEFKCSGLNFFYLPKVAEHYRETNPQLFKNVCRFLAPGYDDTELNNMISYIKMVNTKKFCLDQLFGKLGMSAIYNTKPGLLIHIGTSFVDNKLYNNFLKVSLQSTKNPCEQILSFLDTYTKYLSYDIVVIPKTDETDGHFLYGGFYKFIYDLYLYRKAESTTVLIDTVRQSIFFPQIGRDFELNVSRRERALYALILMESINGGVKFTSTDNYREDEKQRKELSHKFKVLYLMLGGRPDKIPDMTDDSIRRPSICHINKFFENSSQIMNNHSDYRIKKKKDGTLFVSLDKELVTACSPEKHDTINLFDSSVYSKYLES